MSLLLVREASTAAVPSPLRGPVAILWEEEQGRSHRWGLPPLETRLSLAAAVDRCAAAMDSRTAACDLLAASCPIAAMDRHAATVDRRLIAVTEPCTELPLGEPPGSGSF